MTFLNSLAMGAGWTLMFGLAFWALCVAASYVRIGIQRLAKKAQKPTRIQELREKVRS
jgi:hypothetical protein